MAAADFAARGAVSRDAHAEAARLFGNELYQRESARGIFMGSPLVWIEGLWHDVTRAARRLWRSPVFTLFSLFTLILGIGSTTAVSAIVQAALGPPPGVPHIDRVVNVFHARLGSVPIISLSWPDYEDLRTRQRAFDSLAGWTFASLTVTNGVSAEIGIGELVGGDYFRVLGVSAALGRTLQASDDAPDAPPVVVISQRLWQRMFDASPQVLGKVVKINGLPCVVVGVIDPSFPGSFNGGAVPSSTWTTLSTSRLMNAQRTGRDFASTSRDHRWLFVKAKLASGRTMADAQADVRRIGHDLDQEFPLHSDDPSGVRAYNTSRLWEAIPASAGRFDELTNRVARPLGATLLIVVGLVLMVACTNLANLALARWTDRRHEIATRLALGASRGRVLREILLETLMIAVPGSLAGVMLAQWLFTLMVDIPITRGAVLRLAPQIDHVSGIVAIGATVLASLVTGLIPGLHATRRAGRISLTDTTISTTARWRTRRYLVAGQVAVSALLISVAALCVMQVRSQSEESRGLDMAHVALGRVNFSTQSYDAVRATQLMTAITGVIAQQPGVARSAASAGLPGLSTTAGVSLKRPNTLIGKYGQFVPTSPGLFDTLGIVIRQGRDFDGRDQTGSAPTVILDTRAAEALFGDEQPIGQQVQLQRGQWTNEAKHPEELRTVVAVVSAAMDTGRVSGGVAYVPLAQAYEPDVVFSARTTGDPAALAEAIRRTIRSVDPELGIDDTGIAAAMLNPMIVFLVIVAGLATALGGFALVLAIVGLYGILAHIVGLRTREIGLRLALGGEATQIRRMVMREGLSPVILGLVLGLGLGAIPRVALRPQFRGLLPAFDLSAIVVVTIVFLAAGMAACYIPARRASRVDPNVALRSL